MQNALLDAVTQAIGTVIGWIGIVLQALLGTAGDGAAEYVGVLSPLLPLFAIGISISAIMLGVKIIKSFIWGS